MNKTLRRINDIFLILLTTLCGVLFYLDARYVFGSLDENSWTEFDYSFYTTISSNVSEEGAGIWRFFTMLASSKFIITLTSIMLIVIGILMIAKKVKSSKENWIDLLYVEGVTLLSSGLLCEVILKGIFKRPRPDVTALVGFHGFSFPSGHTACSVTFFWLLGDVLAHLVKKYERRHGEKKHMIILLRILLYIYRLIAIAISFAVGYSRIYLGAHYATDVFAGFLVGVIMYLISTKIYRRIIK